MSFYNFMNLSSFKQIKRPWTGMSALAFVLVIIHINLLLFLNFHHSSTHLNSLFWTEFSTKSSQKDTRHAKVIRKSAISSRERKWNSPENKPQLCYKNECGSRALRNASRCNFQRLRWRRQRYEQCLMRLNHWFWLRQFLCLLVTSCLTYQLLKITSRQNDDSFSTFVPYTKKKISPDHY